MRFSFGSVIVKILSELIIKIFFAVKDDNHGSIARVD